MLMKIALVVAVIGAVWLLATRRSGPGPSVDRQARRAKPIETLEQCPRCGEYRVLDARCRCGDGAHG